MTEVIFSNGYYYVIHILSGKTWKYRYLHAHQAYAVQTKLHKSWMHDTQQEDFDLRHNVGMLIGDELCTTVTNG